MTSAAALREVLAQVHDPEIPVITIEDLGILRDVQVEGERVVVFFFPLETGFGWPPDQPVRLHERPHPSLLDAISRLTGTDREPEQYGKCQGG